MMKKKMRKKKMKKKKKRKKKKKMMKEEERRASTDENGILRNCHTLLEPANLPSGRPPKKELETHPAVDGWKVEQEDG